MGIEPTYPAWKAGVLADVLIPHWLLTEAELCTTPNETASLSIVIFLSPLIRPLHKAPPRVIGARNL